MGKAEGEKSQPRLFNFPLNKAYTGIQGNTEPANSTLAKTNLLYRIVLKKLNSAKPTTGSNWYKISLNPKLKCLCLNKDLYIRLRSKIQDKLFCTLFFLHQDFRSLGNSLAVSGKKKYPLEVGNFLILH